MAMRSAVAVSEEARGISSPNPPVGAVVLDTHGTVVGIGTTEAPGHRHAEIVALDQAGDQARGGTLVVTLEPCNHQGLTGPCSQAILRAGIVAVYYAVADPNPLAAGGGDTLREAGVTVVGAVCENEARRGPLRAWLHRQATGLPWVTLKFASTLDGKAAAPDGSSQWITSAETRSAVHEERSHIDAIVVGTGTVLADSPSLTAREDDGRLKENQPLRVIVGLRDIPDAFRGTEDSAGTAPWLHMRTNDLSEVLRILAQQGCLEVQIEGGPRLSGAFVEADLIDGVTAYIAPALLGAGRAVIESRTVETIGDIRRYDIVSMTRLSQDMRIELERKRVSESWAETDTPQRSVTPPALR